MIPHLDNLLRHLFLSKISALTSANQVRFRPPDEDWRTEVANLQDLALNVYLVELRENRKLRSNERVRTITNGIVNEDPAPVRVDCHYLISAWSPAAPSPALEPTVDEHDLLYQIASVLILEGLLNPSRIYPPGSPPLDPNNPNAVPELIRNVDLPIEIVPVEGFPKYAEFWGTMGVNYRWKPAVYLIVTLPVALLTEVAGPMVTTRITEYRQGGLPETAEVWIQIGGHVLDALNPLSDGSPAPVINAWVRLETMGGEPLQTTETNAQGRFTFGDLQPGQYQLNWRALGHPLPAAPRHIDVPSPTGEYDLIFQ